MRKKRVSDGGGRKHKMAAAISRSEKQTQGKQRAIDLSESATETGDGGDVGVKTGRQGKVMETARVKGALGRNMMAEERGKGQPGRGYV